MRDSQFSTRLIEQQHHTAPRTPAICASPQYAEVAVPFHVFRTFTYRLPAALQRDARLGARLLVPFNRQMVTAYIVALHDELDPGIELDQADVKEAEELLDAAPLLTPEVLEITRWIAEYYAAPWGEVLKAALPAGLNSTIEQVLTITPEGRDELARLPAKRAQSIRARILCAINERGEITLRALAKEIERATALRGVRELERAGWIKLTHRALTAQAKPKRRKIVRLLAPKESGRRGDETSTFTPAQERIIAALIGAGGEMLYAALLEMAETSASTIQTLERKNFVEVTVRDVRRDPLARAKIPVISDLQLTLAQQHAFDEIKTALARREYAAFLLHGVTGSGKTEIYIRAMRAALDDNRAAMMLVPEIALTPVFSRRLRAHFGDEVAIFHSSLTTGERFDEWSRLRRGEARVVIGTRSAVFAPIANLGVVIIDEEHEASYRQQESPYYSGRDTAVVRALKERAVVVLGSATPSLESFYNTRINRYRYLSLPTRIADRQMARAEIIDMREAFAAAGKQIAISDALWDALAETHTRGEQSIILLNRRGYSSFILCRSCGERVQCPNCDVTLTFHRHEHNLVCHYCNYRCAVPQSCPSCDGSYIYFIGEGTEQIEEMLQQRFPRLRIARLDRDTTARRHTYEEAILRFGAGELDMLVGTQMIAKGHDFPNVTLVGVISVDAGLALPDFRAAERSFQLITQVAGRAGRGDLAGRVLIQTFHPEHYALRHACAQDYATFYDEEIRYRENMNYPPFVALASLLVHDENLTQAQETATLLRRTLDEANADRACRVLGPAPAPLARLRGEHRLQILIKARSRPRLRRLLDLALGQVIADKSYDPRRVNVEIDPVNLM